MKKNLTPLAMAALLCAGTAQAQAPANNSNSDVTHRPYMERMDTNQDGVVSKAEYQTFMAGAFAKLDKDQNGELSQEELATVTTAEQFSTTDANGDGKISRAEFDNRVMVDFAAADTDNDGELR